jgi:hypothetical protein
MTDIDLNQLHPDAEAVAVCPPRAWSRLAGRCNLSRLLLPATGRALCGPETLATPPPNISVRQISRAISTL